MKMIGEILTLICGHCQRFEAHLRALPKIRSRYAKSEDLKDSDGHTACGMPESRTGALKIVVCSHRYQVLGYLSMSFRPGAASIRAPPRWSRWEDSGDVVEVGARRWATSICLCRAAQPTW
jgi:hypothetical protein